MKRPRIPEPPNNPYYGFAAMSSVLGFLLIPVSVLVNAVDPLGHIGVWMIIASTLMIPVGLWKDNMYEEPATTPPAEPGGYVTV